MTSDRDDLLGRLFSAKDEGQVAGSRSIVVVVAHPDDETIGMGGHLRMLRPVALVHVTDGAPADMRDARAAGFPDCASYAAARRQEFLDAMVVAGLDPEYRLCLGLVDQEAAYELGWLAESVRQLLEQIEPEVVMTHAYEGGHPDHDATALAVHAACWQIGHRGRSAPPIVEMTSYHNRAGEIAVGEFLPWEESPVRILSLSAAQQELKRAMIRCYRTQAKMLQSFGVTEERFRIAPRYDFRDTPHHGVLFYEMFPWGMSGDRWKELAGELLDGLDIRDRL